MENQMIENYLESIRKQFLYYKELGDKTFVQLIEEDFFWSPDEQSNAIAVIIQHMYGNMMSRWTDFLTSDGEKEWRNREQEFELYLVTKEQLLIHWEKGWACLFHALSEIDSQNIKQLIYIRSKGHTIIEAINRQLAHYAYHVGQLTYLGRQRALHWESLSIPKGGSELFNKTSFEKGKRREHFTAQFLDHTKAKKD